LSITVDIGEAGCVVHLEGEIEIGSAAKLKSALADALASGKEVWLDLALTADFDVTAIQLLWSASHEAAQAGTLFGVAGTVPEPVSSLLRDGGFANFLATLNPGAKPETAQAATGSPGGQQNNDQQMTINK
jgi:anti-anti-sigma regulatory factor